MCAFVQAPQAFLGSVRSALAGLELDQQSNTAAPPQQHSADGLSDTQPESDDTSTDATAATATGTASPPWDAWCEHIRLQDQAAVALTQLQQQLESAVASEQYADAAAVNAEIADLKAEDAVGGVQRELQAALAEERYADAARLRDDGWAWLEGWWCGQGESDPAGHLLHIKAGYGRWVGKVYTPRDLAELKGWADDESGAVMFRFGRTAGYNPRLSASGAVAGVLASDAGSSVSLEELGSPVMEVFVKKDPGSSGSSVMQSQVVSLWSSAPPGLSAAGGMSALEQAVKADFTGSDDDDSATLMVSVLVDDDGTASIEYKADTSSSPSGSDELSAPQIMAASSDEGTQADAAHGTSCSSSSVPVSVFNDWEKVEALATLMELRVRGRAGWLALLPHVFINSVYKYMQAYRADSHS